MKKAALLFVLLTLLLCLTSCKEKQSLREETYETLTYVSEELGMIEDLFYENYDNGYDELHDALYDISQKCNELKKKIDNLAFKFREKER